MDNYSFNYNHLFYFKTIVEQGSIAKSSKLLRIGAPAISMQLKHLEDYIQKPLFIRANKKLILTDTGRMVYDYAKNIFNLGTELLTTLYDQEYGQIKIQIGMQDCVPKNLVSSVTSYIYDHYDALISVYNGGIEGVTLGIAQHKFDLAILNHPPIIKDKSILYSRRALKSPIVLAASPQFIKLKNKPFSKFNKQPFILPMGNTSLRHKLEQFFRKEEIDIQIAGEAEDTVIQKNMAISGNGIVPIMEDAIKTYIKTKQLIVLKTIPDVFEEIWLVSGKRQIPNPIADKIMKDFKF